MRLYMLQDIRPFLTVTGSGFVDYSQSLIIVASLHGDWNVADLLQNYPRNTERKLIVCANH